MKTKARHNKKRNTAFLYEVLVRELTAAVIAKDEGRKATIASVIKEGFKKNTALWADLKCYKALEHTTIAGLDKEEAHRYLQSVKSRRQEIDTKELFKEQSSLIKKVNHKLTTGLFSSYVPNYKNLATIYQIFSDKTPLKSKVMMESQLIGEATQLNENKEEKPVVDKLVVKSFVEKYNKRYKGLLPEQKDLLSKYIASFSDNGVELKVALNTEVQRLREAVTASLKLEEVSSDEDMVENTKKVLSVIDSFRGSDLNESLFTKVLKLQELVKEYTADADND